MRSLYRNSALAFALLLSVATRSASSQTLLETQQLDFGTIVVSDYSAVSRVTVNPNGSYSTSATTYVVEPPDNGAYNLTGGPPNSTYTLTFPPSMTLMGPGGEVFTIDNFTTAPGLLITDGSGEDSFTLGARAQSGGGGIIYMDGNYNGTLDITINF